MAFTLIVTSDPPPSTRVIIRRVRVPHDSRRAIPTGRGTRRLQVRAAIDVPDGTSPAQRPGQPAERRGPSEAGPLSRPVSLSR